MTIDFKSIRLRANGMLSQQVYEQIYQTAYEAKQGNIVEVGTAHGAATIALALGLKDSGKQSKVYTFEKITGGSREQYGGIDENTKIIQENFKESHVESSVELFIGDVETEYEKLRKKVEFISQPISLLMLDADGSIDRDFSYFYNQLLPGSTIIIDDCDDRIKVKYITNNKIKIDLKHKLTHELIEFFIDQGFLEKIETIGNTFFGKKPDSIEHIVNFNELNLQKIYRKLVFTEGNLPESKNSLNKVKFMKNLLRKIPGLFSLYQAIKQRTQKSDLFSTIKSLTNGYLSPETYKTIYTLACQAQSGNMIDIGPAQGGSTISIGLGVRDSGKAKKSTVYSIEKCVGSNALPSLNNQDLNASILKHNVERYGLSSICKVLVGDVKEVVNEINDNLPLSLMFIDADGALDRDFRLFYNRLLPGSPIILDDYVNKINRLATERYLNWSTEEEINSYVTSKGAEKFIDLCPLGKEYTVYRFVNYFIEQNLLKLDRIIGTTFFGYKTEYGVFNPELHVSDLMKIREEILNRYYELNENFKGKPV